MAFFKTKNSKAHYIALFFSRRKIDECSGALMALSTTGIQATLLLPALATVISLATLIEVLVWLAYLFLGAQPSAFLDRINWAVAITSVVIAAAGGMLVSFSQLHAVKSRDFFYGDENCMLRVDWIRSVPTFVINVLFAVNGILFSLWAYLATSEGELPEATGSVTYTILGFGLLLLPGALRLAWLYRLRDIGEVRWRQR